MATKLETKLEKLQNFCDNLIITDSGTGNHPHYHVYFTYNNYYSCYAEIKYDDDFDCEFSIYSAIDDIVTDDVLDNKIYNIDVCAQSLRSCIYKFLSNNLNSNKSGAKPHK